jgi:hypothetical protein
MNMAKMKSCDCCLSHKSDIEEREWGRMLRLCATCRKQGRAKVLARIQARGADAPTAGAPATAEGVERARGAAAAGGDRDAIDGSTQNPPAPEPAAPRRRRSDPKERKPTVAAAIRALVDQGKTNAEIWAAIQPAFGLADDKRWYPAWYRRQYARKRGVAQAEG